MLVSCTSKNTETQKTDKITEIEGFALPEGACADNDYIYISNVGKEFKPLDKDSDGFISKVDKATGKVVDLNFLPKNDTLHSPKGMAIIKNILYVTDIDRIVGFDLNTQETVFELDFSEENTVLLNDLSVKDYSTLFVSAMDIGKVFEVDLKSNSYKAILAIPKPNGLCWSEANKTLFIGQFGRDNNSNGDKGDIGKLVFNADTSVFETITTHQGNIDGVTLINDTLYFTDWLSKNGKGSLHYIALTSPNQVHEAADLNIDGPGDFHYDASTETFWLPKMRENKVIYFKK